MTATGTPPGIEDVLALSPLQQGLYSLAGLTEEDTGADPYVIAMAADIEGAVDPALLRSCAEAMLVRHPNLRASFFQGNLTRPVAVVPTAVDLPWRHVTAPTAEAAAAIEAEERTRRFDLGRGPLIRFLLIEMPAQRWRLVVTAHHIAIDGWSLPVFVGEYITLYAADGDTAVFPAAPRPYRDYIGWLAGRDHDASRARWRAHLDGLDARHCWRPRCRAARPNRDCPHAPRSRWTSRRPRRSSTAHARGVSRSTRCSRWPGRQSSRRSPTAPTWCTA